MLEKEKWKVNMEIKEYLEANDVPSLPRVIEERKLIYINYYSA